MKKYLILFVAILVIGVIIIALPSKESPKPVSEGFGGSTLQQSDSNTIIDPELSFDEVEPELYDEDQMYFKYSDGMYNYLKLNQVDKIKDRLQSFIKHNFSDEIDECEFDIDSIVSTSENISFQVIVPKHETIYVTCTKDSPNTVVDINLSITEVQGGK